MADNRKYYYLKLKENFFDSDSIVLLEDMKDGILYSNILLKLYLKSLKNGGKLQLDEHIPYTAQMIATLTRHQIGTVERALEIFRQLGLVEQLDSGAFYMTDIELMICTWILPLWLCPSGWVQTKAWCPGKCSLQNCSPSSCARSTVKPLSVPSRGSKLMI
jgi:predicted phage replisome organizer